EFAKKIKNLGYLVKLDTNGSNPEMLEKMISENLVDYIAMDIKAPIERYSEIANCRIDEKNIKKSIEILKEKAPDYELRTTFVKNQLNDEDFEKIGDMIKGSKRFFIQKFASSKALNDKSFETRQSPDNIALERIKKIMLRYIDEVNVR
ncbi:MAG: anaerobic ribonucleoside-triphosphate reductase activating protein, partial [Candidatus Moranbacteria bacterium]|nr:anaerobic ribonucleoside-triphosphate reductase activating protein [Candidatus Moranbacteria bacterium]